MKTTQCPVCDSTLARGVLCKGHREKISDNLETAKKYAYELDRYVNREVKTSESGAHSSAAFPQSPVSESFWDLREEFDNVIYDVAASIPVYDYADVKQCISRILRRVDRLAVTRECKSSYERIERLLLKVKQRITPVSEKIIFGDCPKVECGHPLFGIPEQETVKCVYCGSEWNVDDIRIARRFKSLTSTETATAHEIAVKLQKEGYSIKEATIRQWAHRGKLLAADIDDNATRYLLSDVYALVKLKTTQQKCA